MFAVKRAAAALSYEDRGTPLVTITSHSSRSEGACVLHMAGFSNRAIKKMGRWSPKPETFNEYIPKIPLVCIGDVDDTRTAEKSHL